MKKFKETLSEVKMSKKRFKSELVWNIDQGETPKIVGVDIMKMVKTPEFQDFMWDDFQSKSSTSSLNDFEKYVDGLVNAMKKEKSSLDGLDSIKKLIKGVS